MELEKLEAEKELGEARERTEMAELECTLDERELSGAKTGMNVGKSPGTMTEANWQLVSFQGVSRNSD